MNKQIYNKFIKNADEKFVVDTITNSVYTYNDILKKSAGLANLLYENKFYRGSKIAYIQNNSVDFIAYYFAVLFLGATAIPLNPNYTQEDYAFVIDKIQPDVILLSDQTLNTLMDKRLQDHYRFISTDIIGLNDLKAEKLIFDLPDLQWDDLAAVLFTSGTTGKPKGVGMKYGAVFENLSIYGKDMQFNADTRYMQIVPLFHAHGWLYSSIVPALFDSSIILNEPFNIRLCSKFWDIVEQHGGNVLVAVPSVLTALLEMSKRYTKIPKKLLDCVICGSSFLHTNLKTAFESTFDTIIYEWYGSTETVYLAYHAPGIEFVEGTVGKLFPHNVDIKIGDNSEICVKTKYFFEGYVNDIELTKETFDDEGWYHTGDTGNIDGAGYVRLSGRIKNIINKGGYKVSPVEIDTCLLEYENIVDAATIGVPDEMYGEEIYSFVTVRNANEFNEQNLFNHCKAHLSETICPKRIIPISSVPRNPMGKTDKFKLAQVYAQLRTES
jgi:acyl-CoA synthetase (AMP-forming)/AMP-acid ligase II